LNAPLATKWFNLTSKDGFKKMAEVGEVAVVALAVVAVAVVVVAVVAVAVVACKGRLFLKIVLPCIA